MQKKLHFIAIISILVVLSLTVLASAAGAGGGGEANPGNPVPFQITIISPENDSIVTEDMLSDVTVSEKEYGLVKSWDNQLEIGEPIGPSSQGVIDFVDDDDLSVLADEIFVVNGGKYKYEQFLHFDKPTMKVDYDENDDLFLKVMGNEEFARYEINFLTAPKSVITDSQGNPTPDGDYLPDFQNAKLTILGKEYTIFQATKPAGNASVKLELMAGHKSDVILVEESKTFTFDNKEYAVHLISVDGDKIEVIVNVDLLEMQSGTVYGLSDGTPISANIFWAGSEPVITLFFNAEKMVLQDDNTGGSDNLSTYKLMINDETIDGAEVVIRGSIFTNQEIDTIFINMSAGNDYLVPENGKLSDAIEAAGNQKEVLMNGLFDFEYHGLNEEGLPLVYVIGIMKETKKGLPLQVSTEENVVCSYSLGEGYEEMEVTGETSHLQYLFDLVKGQDYEVSVQCVEEEESNTQSVNFHVAEDSIAPQITIISPEDDSIVTNYLVSESIILSEFWKIENGEDKLEIGEPISDVIEKVGGEEINALSENTWFIEGIEYDYEQTLYFDSEDAQNEVVTFAEDDGQADDYFYIKKDEQIARYSVNFESPVPSEVDAGHLIDLEGTSLTLFGKEYSIFKAEKIYQQGVKLTLMDTSFNEVKYLELEDHDVTDDISTYYKDVQKDTLLEGESKTYTVDGKEYGVHLLFTDSSNKAKFTINGETTPLMDGSTSFALSDGIILTLDKVLYQDFAGGVHQAEFSLKAIISSELIFNNQIIDGAHITIKGTIDDEAASLSSIEVDMIAQDDYYVAPGETLLQQPELEEKDLLFNKNWDMRFEFPGVETHKISVEDKAGEKEYWLTFTNNAGQNIEFPVAYADNSNLNLGSISNKLNLENFDIGDNQYFILNTGTDENSVTNVIQYKGADDNGVSGPIMMFKVLATGETVQRSVSFDSNGIATASIKLSGTTYIVTSVGDTSGDDYNISVAGGTDTFSSNPYGWETYLIAKGGARIKIAENEIDSNKSIKVDVSLIDHDYVGDTVIVSQDNPYVVSAVDIIAVDNKVDFTNYTGIDLTSPANDNDNAYGYSANGVLVKLDSFSDGTSDNLIIEWPETQRLPQVYITTTEAKYYTYYIDLLAETDENAVCSYNLGNGYEIMSQTGGKNHYQALIGLVFENSYEVTIQCTDEAGNTNIQSTYFYFGEDTTPPKITFKSPQNNSIVKEDMLSEVTIYSTEAWKVENGDDLLEFQESISDVVDKIGGNELTALADNNWLINETENLYEQSLSFPLININGAVKYVEDDDDITDYFLTFYDNKPIATYNLQFTSPAQSTIDNDILTDFQGTTLTLFGKEYHVFRAERPFQNNIKLTLMNNFISDFISKDETKIFSLSDISYEITPTFMNEEYAQFKINGETTSMLKVGRMYLLANGITFGVIEIKDNNAKFILGTEKLELWDKDITNDLSSDEVTVNSELIDGAKIKIKGTDENSIVTISSLEVNMTAQDDYYVAPEETLLGQPELTEKDLLFTRNWNIKYDGWTTEVTNMISLKDKNNGAEYVLTFTNTEGQVIELPLAEAESINSGQFANLNRLKLENSNIADEQYFILNHGTGEDTVSNVVQYKGADNATMKFKILGTDEIVESQITFDEGSVATATLELSGTTYTIHSVGDTSQDDYNISVTGGAETSSSNPYGWENYLVAKNGARIDIAESKVYQNTKSIKVNISLIDPDGVGDTVLISPENPYVVSSVNIIAIDNKVDFDTYTGIVLTIPDDDKDNAYGYAINGAFVKLNSPNAPGVNPDTLEIEWPEKQRLPLVYITAATGTSTKQALPFELSTDENAICSYSLGQEYQEMETTGTKNHVQNLFDLEDEKDYTVSVQCVDESGNTDAELLKFHFGKVAEPAEEPSPQNQPSNSGGGGSSSSKKDDDDDNDEDITEYKTVKSDPPQETKKTSEEPIQQPLADNPAGDEDLVGFANSLTGALIGVAEKGGLIYAVGFILILFSLAGIKFVYSKKD